MTILQKLEFKKRTEHILHAPGGYRGGILEMTLVFDCHLPCDLLTNLSVELVNTLKQSSDIFRNVRLNTLKWCGNAPYTKSISSFPNIILGKELTDYQYSEEVLYMDELTRQLKVFYARSRLIILLTDEPSVLDSALVQKNLQPFLHRKLLLLHSDGSCSPVSVSTF